jgi:hypothetical protein
MTKDRCKNNGTIARFPPGIQDFAKTFVDLQVKRHEADYDPAAKFYKSDVDDSVGQAEDAVKVFGQAAATDRRAFCAYVLLKDRGGR